MEIILKINAEQWTYKLDDSDIIDSDFMEAVFGFDSLLRSAYPSFDGHSLVALCPDGNIHEKDLSAEELNEPGKDIKKPNDGNGSDGIDLGHKKG